MNPERAVLVLGGYGVFGRLVCEALIRAGMPVIVAGRDFPAAALLASSLGARAGAARMDARSPALAAEISAVGPSLVVNTAGPFQSRDYAVPRACIAARVHYIDLADARAYVAGIDALDADALARDVLVTSGASTCPALTTSIVEEIGAGLRIEAIAFGIAPGLRQARGLATARAVLAHCGRSIPVLARGASRPRMGWGGSLRHEFPAPVGRRWLSRVDLPEQTLWPARYPALAQVESRAGIEPAILHLGLVGLSWLVRMRLIESLAPHAELLLRVAARCEHAGSAAGAMYVEVEGRDAAGAWRRRTWSIVAEHGDGLRIPVAPAIAAAKRLLGVRGCNPLDVRGAHPCIGLLSAGEILAELDDYAIRALTKEELVRQPRNRSRSPAAGT